MSNNYAKRALYALPFVATLWKISFDTGQKFFDSAPLVSIQSDEKVKQKQGQTEPFAEKTRHLGVNVYTPATKTASTRFLTNSAISQPAINSIKHTISSTI